MHDPENSRQINEFSNWFIAEVFYVPLEGGFFALVTDEKERLMPLNLPKNYCQHGTKVRVKGQLKNDIMTIQQWGSPFHIEAIELIAPAPTSTPHNDI